MTGKLALSARMNTRFLSDQELAERQEYLTTEGRELCERLRIKNATSPTSELTALLRDLPAQPLDENEIYKQVGKAIYHPDERVRKFVLVSLQTPLSRARGVYRTWVTSQKLKNPSRDTGERAIDRVRTWAWTEIARAETRRAREAGEAISPILEQIFDEILETYPTKAFTGQIPLDANIHEAWETFMAWARTSADPADVRQIAEAGDRIKTIVAHSSPVAASGEGVLEAVQVFGNQLESTARNKHLTQAGYEVAAEVAIQHLTSGRGKEECAAFFQVGARRGFRLTPSQVMSARVALEMATQGDQERAGRAAANVPEIASSQHGLKAVLETYPAGAKGMTAINMMDLIARMLKVTRGPAWARVLAEAEALSQRVPLTTEKTGSEILLEGLAASDNWSLEGVDRSDILFLVNHGDARVRAEGLRIAGIISQTQKRDPCATKAREATR